MRVKRKSPINDEKTDFEVSDQIIISELQICTKNELWGFQYIRKRTKGTVLIFVHVFKSKQIKGTKSRFSL